MLSISVHLVHLVHLVHAIFALPKSRSCPSREPTELAETQEYPCHLSINPRWVAQATRLSRRATRLAERRPSCPLPPTASCAKSRAKNLVFFRMGGGGGG